MGGREQRWGACLWLSRYIGFNANVAVAMASRYLLKWPAIVELGERGLSIFRGPSESRLFA